MTPSRLDKPLVEWTAVDVFALIDERIEEGPRLEYKRDLPLDRDRDRREVAKDVSGMANASGGLIIYGVDEEETPDGLRLPTRASPIRDGDAQARLEDVVWSSVSLRPNCATKMIATDGGYFLIVRVQPRAGVPHMVEAGKDCRYYVRTGLSTRPMEAREVEAAFRQASQAAGRADALIASLPFIPRLAPGRKRCEEQEAEPGDLPWVSVVALPLDAPEVLLEMRQPTRNDFPPVADAPRIGPDPGYVWSGSFLIDAHGYIQDEPTEADDVQVLCRRLRLYRQGALEWGVRYSGRDGDFLGIASATLVENVHDAISYFASVYRRVNYFGRVRLVVGLDNADRAIFLVEARRPRPRQPQVEAISYSEDTNVESLLASSLPAVHAAMDRIWQAYGYPCCWHFTREGQLQRDPS